MRRPSSAVPPHASIQAPAHRVLFRLGGAQLARLAAGEQAAVSAIGDAVLTGSRKPRQERRGEAVRAYVLAKEECGIGGQPVAAVSDACGAAGLVVGEAIVPR